VGIVKIAHLSDLHVLDLAGVPARAYANKRLLGYANIRFKRKHVHKADIAAKLFRDVVRAKVDHVVITGDLTNLALESEFRAALRLIGEELGLPEDRVSIIPGNHDAYVSEPKLRPFSTLFAGYTSSELPEFSLPLGGGNFPFVRIRGPVAIIGLSSAVPRPPFVAAGVLGEAQRKSLRAILRHPEVRDRTPVVLVHHPSYPPSSRLKSLVEGLHDGADLERDLAESHPALILHGHLHRRVLRKGRGHGGLQILGATSASLHHHDPDRMAGYNIYDIDENGRLVSASAQVLDEESGAFVERFVPESIW
jgi:3',5'-cyclic AMP phosphodiesterase CpdA